MSRLQFSVARPGQFPKCGRFFADLLSKARTAEIRDVATEAVPRETLWQYNQSRTISQSGPDVCEVGNLSRRFDHLLSIF